MEKIALAKKVEFIQDAKSKNGTIIVEPLYPGYGMTLGNSLRRVLLSSLSGAAVVGVKIKGAKHEFMPLSGVKEDVIDIVLSLKQLRLKIFSKDEEPIKLELNVKGRKQVTAADIDKNAQVEIINKDLVLANTTETTSNLSMDIYVAKGRGYSLVERNKKDGREIDYMDIDSIFSPILAVSAEVENVRVGKMTNWDKLILNVETDGTITIKDAFEKSVQILIDQFGALAPGASGDEVKKEEKKEDKKESKENKEDKEEDGDKKKGKK